MLSEKSINVFVLLLLIAILGGMGAIYYDNSGYRMVSYASEILLILFTLFFSRTQAGSDLANKPLILIALILTLNYLFSPYEHSPTDLLKYFGYFCCYKYGDVLARKYDRVKVDRLLLATIVIIPLMIVLLFDHTVEKNAFFVTPNTFVYIGLAMGLLYALTHYGNTLSFWIAWAIVSFYVLTCASLGIVVAIIIAYLVLNFKLAHLPYFILGTVAITLAIVYLDFPVFVRARDVIHLWQSISIDEWRHVQELNMYDITTRIEIAGARTDVSSSVWRVSQWTGLVQVFLNDPLRIPFGEGVGFCKDYTGLMPHNDFLLILVDYGAIVFGIVVLFISRVFKHLKKEMFLTYFLFSMVLYHLTENLIQSFAPNVVLYFTLGWCMVKYRIANLDMNGAHFTT